MCCSCLQLKELISNELRTIWCMHRHKHNHWHGAVVVVVVAVAFPFAEWGEKMPLCAPPKHLLCVSGGLLGMIALWFIPSRLCRWLGNHARTIHHTPPGMVYTTTSHVCEAVMLWCIHWLWFWRGKWDRQKRCFALLIQAHASANNNHIILFDIQRPKFLTFAHVRVRLTYYLGWQTELGMVTERECQKRNNTTTTKSDLDVRGTSNRKRVICHDLYKS